MKLARFSDGTNVENERSMKVTRLQPETFRGPIPVSNKLADRQVIEVQSAEADSVSSRKQHRRNGDQHAQDNYDRSRCAADRDIDKPNGLRCRSPCPKGGVRVRTCNAKGPERLWRSRVANRDRIGTRILAGSRYLGACPVISRCVTTAVRNQASMTQPNWCGQVDPGNVISNHAQ